MHTYTGTVKNVYIPTLIRLNMIQAYEGLPLQQDLALEKNEP